MGIFRRNYNPLYLSFSPCYYINISVYRQKGTIKCVSWVFSGGIIIHYIYHFPLSIIPIYLFIGRNVPLKMSSLPSFLQLQKITQIFSVVKFKKNAFMPAKMQLYYLYVWYFLFLYYFQAVRGFCPLQFQSFSRPLKYPKSAEFQLIKENLRRQ